MSTTTRSCQNQTWNQVKSGKIQNTDLTRNKTFLVTRTQDLLVCQTKSMVTEIDRLIAMQAVSEIEKEEETGTESEERE